MRIDLKTASIVLFTDVSFGNARKEKRKLAYIIVLDDKKDKANITHFSSRRCKRVTKSGMARERHELVLRLDA